MNTNEQILAERSAKLDKKTGIRVGDYLKLSTGQYLRFSHDWGDKVQTTASTSGDSFYLSALGCSFSGGLYPSIEKEKITQIQETKLGGVWFFKDNYHTAHNSINFEIPFRVFELTDKDFEKSYINTWLSN